MREFRALIWLVFYIGMTLTAFSVDQLVFKNGDRVSGTFLGRSDSTIFFESENFGTLKIAVEAAEVILQTPLAAHQDDSVAVEIPHPIANPVVAMETPLSTDKSVLEDPIKVSTSLRMDTESDTQTESNTTLGLLWESAEKTLNRFVHDRVPDWFPKLPADWKGEVKFGFNLNESVSTTKRYYGDLNFEGDKPRNNYQLQSHFAFAKQDDSRSENDWGLSARYRYKRTDTDFVETLATHDVDELSEPHLRTTSSVGLGIKPYNNSKLKIDTVLGGALERLEHRNADPDTSFKLNFNENLQWKFNKHMTMKQSLRFYVSPEDDLNYNYRFESGLDALIVGAFNLGLSYRLDFDSSIEDKDARQKSKIVTSLGVKF